jgi:hypothetical protein
MRTLGLVVIGILALGGWGLHVILRDDTDRQPVFFTYDQYAELASATSEPRYLAALHRGQGHRLRCRYYVVKSKYRLGYERAALRSQR